MSRVVSTVFVLAAVLAAGISGYWLAQERAGVLTSVARQPAQQPSGPAIYYQDPDGKPSYSAEPKRTADGRPYRAVYASEDVSFDEPEQQAATSAPAGRKILYYRHPMGLPDTSPVPKKDWMGMDYIAVYEGEEQDDGKTVKVSLDKVQRSGVRTETVEARVIVSSVRAVGTAKRDEARLTIVTMRSDGFIEELFVNKTGQHVHAGQPLLVEIVEIVCRAGRARAAVRERDDHGLTAFGDVPDHLARRDARVGRLLVSARCHTARTAKLLQTVDEFVATHLAGSVDYRTIDYKSKPVVLLMGNEQAGLPEELAREAGALARIPQAGRADSLNLAIATGIMLFEARRHLLALDAGA